MLKLRLYNNCFCGFAINNVFCFWQLGQIKIKVCDWRVGVLIVSSCCHIKYIRFLIACQYKNSQAYIQAHYQTAPNPVDFVFHGGSGSTLEEIREAIGYGVVKMNIDTDLQWAFWEGVLNNYKKNEAYLQAQLGNPEGAEKPNKKYYDPRVWLRKGEETFMARLKVAFEDLNCINRNA